MVFLKKYKTELLVLGGLIILYFVLRLSAILSLPIFTDEAIYIRWAQIAKQDANWRFISLTDGKQPMFIWLMMVSLRFIQDPLLAGRMVSVGAGFFSLIGMYFLGREIFKSSRIGLISSALYLVFPMALIYDRMALYDSLVGMFAIWALFLAILLVRRLRLDIALILGIIAGGGVLTKTNAFFSIYSLPFSLLLFNFREKNIGGRLVRWLGLALVSVLLVFGFYSVLRLSPFFHIIDEKNAIFVYPFREWIQHPLEFFIINFRAFWDWISRYLTLPLILLAIYSFFIPKFMREKITLFIWFLFPLVSLAFFGKTLYPRFLFFMILPLLPLIAFSLENIYLRLKRVYFVIFILIFFFFVVKNDYFILTNFAKSHIPQPDMQQYLTSWPAGGGIKKTVEFFEDEAKKGKIHIATQGTFGLMPFAYEIYLIKNPNIEIEGYWPVGDEIPKKAIEKSREMTTYFVFYQPCVFCTEKPAIGVAPSSWNLKPVFQVQSGVASFTTIYKIN